MMAIPMPLTTRNIPATSFRFITSLRKSQPINAVMGGTRVITSMVTRELTIAKESPVTVQKTDVSKAAISPKYPSIVKKQTGGKVKHFATY